MDCRIPVSYTHLDVYKRQTLDFNGAYQALSEAITDKKRTIDLNSCPAVYVKAAVMKDDPDLKNSLDVYKRQEIYSIIQP